MGMPRNKMRMIEGMDKSFKTLLHLGAPKTASSALQKYIFDKQSFAENIGKPFKSKKLRRYEYTVKNNYENYILSDEDLILPLSYDLGISVNEDCDGILKGVVFDKDPDLIILVVRNQSDLINSWYNYHFTRGRINSESFEEYWNRECEEKLKRFILKSLDYNNVVFKLEKKFPNSKIKIFQFEEIKNNMRVIIDEVNELFNIVGDDYSLPRENDRVKVNKSLNVPMIIKRSLGLDLYNKIRFKVGRSVKLEGIKENQKKEIFSYYEISNKALFFKFNLKNGIKNGYHL